MATVPVPPITSLSIKSDIPGPRSADIVLCHNCGWTANDQQIDSYEGHVKCFMQHNNRMIWAIGDDHILKERPILSIKGPKYMGPDAATTNWVRENTTIPVTFEMRHWEDSRSHFFLMGKVPGESLEKAWPRLSTEEKKQCAVEVVGYLAQLRMHTRSTPQTIDGLPARDMLISSQHQVHPLTEDREIWWARVEGRFSHKTPAWREKFKARYPVRGPYVLTHGDLNTGNIVVQDGHVSGIIDWEHAGFYPEWWEWAVAAVWIEEPDWKYYVLTECARHFGEFLEEANFAMVLRENTDPTPWVRNYESKWRGIFCDCKPYRQDGNWADRAEEVQRTKQALEVAQRRLEEAEAALKESEIRKADSVRWAEYDRIKKAARAEDARKATRYEEA